MIPLLSLTFFTPALATLLEPLSSAPILRPRDVELIESHYIVRMERDVKAASLESMLASIDIKPNHKYSLFQGFSADLTEKQLQSIQKYPGVETIEQDAVVDTKNVEFQVKNQTAEKDNTEGELSWSFNLRKKKAFKKQKNAPWGLARISNVGRNVQTYVYEKSAGTGTCVYVLDSGIDVTHPDFGSRAQLLKNFADNSDTDGLGHGTHIAGTIGGSRYGVAKNTTIFGVKIADNAGKLNVSTILAGMDFVMKDYPSRDCAKGVVVNMSLNSRGSDSILLAANLLVNSDPGIFLAASAGNGGDDAGKYSPAASPKVCTVGATNYMDMFASLSNYGSAIDILAPGIQIASAFPGNNWVRASGSSMATAHVSGLGAYLLGMGKPVKNLCDYITQTSLKGVLDMSNDKSSKTPNRLINNGFR